MRATEGMKKGTLLEMSRSHAVACVEPFLMRADSIGPEKPVPYYLAAGKTLIADVPAGSVITGEMIGEGKDSPLWAMRRKQDAAFPE